MNTTDRLKSHARDRADHPAIEEGQRTLTYRELDAAVDNAAANLQAAEIGVGDVVAVMLPDNTNHLIILCALARVGAVLLPFDVAMQPAAVAKRLAPYSAKAIVQTTPSGAIGGPVPLTVAALCQPATRSFVAPELGGDHPVALVQSSGTTGVPKTILRSHTEKQEWVSRIIPIQGWTQDERCLSLLPICFATGRNVCLAVLELGATLVIDHPGSCEALVATINEHRITYLRLTPPFLRPLLDYAADKAPLFPNLRGIGIGSAPVTASQRRAARESLNPNFIVFYGCNETGCLTTATPADQDAHPDAVGRLVPGVEAEILDSDDRPLGFGEVGLIRFRGPGIATGYLEPFSHVVSNQVHHLPHRLRIRIHISHRQIQR
ncbi:MAG: class I adenylate-forming enzyme family protein [Alphaproteobacteria bacterium]|jgi:acyl-coenzyme A synthetase/AMP-(fatty) acid ligase|nr:class I adenylate-forming enzyme family protein [Alphaproteobacteria bacterium]